MTANKVPRNSSAQLSSEPLATRNTRVVLLFFLLGLLLFVPFLSHAYDLNGIDDAQRAEIGGCAALNARHMLYAPMGRLAWQALQVLVGYHGRTLYVLQIITVLFASLGLSLSFYVFSMISRSTARAALATIGMAVSWGYWRFSTDAYYITVALPFVAGAVSSMLYANSDVERRGFWAVIAGLSCAVAILLWQANVFLLLPLLVGHLILNGSSERIKLAAMTAGIVTIVVGASYVSVGTLICGNMAFHDLYAWLLSSGQSLPLWGRWGGDRLFPLATSYVSSYIPVWEGLGLRNLLRGTITPSKLVGQLSLVSFTILCGNLAVALAYAMRTSKSKRMLIWLLFSFVVYIPFILWWDPYEPKWFVIPNFFFWGVVALAWGIPQVSGRVSSLVLVSLLLVVGVANFSYTILPNRFQPNQMLQLAQCVSERMGTRDVLLATEWSWSGYAEYFGERTVKSLITESVKDNPDATLSLIRQYQHDASQAGGQVIMQSLSSYPPDYLHWLQVNTGFSSTEFQRLQWSPAFECNGIQFVRVEGVE